VVVVCIVGVVALVAVVVVACATGAAGLAWWCFLALCLGFGLAAVAVAVAVLVVVDVVGVVVVVAAAALWLEVDDEAPQALTINTSSEAPSAMRRCLMADSLTPRIWWLAFQDATRAGLLPGESRLCALRPALARAPNSLGAPAQPDTSCVRHGAGLHRI
jgi:hypothetical protein